MSAWPYVKASSVKPVCQFGHILVSGTYDSELDVVVCVTPKMRRMGEVNLQISLDGQGLVDTDSLIIATHLNIRFLSSMSSYDVSSTVR